MGDQSSSSMVLAVITEFTSEFRSAIDGSTDDLSLNELSGGARISFVFHELFNNGVKSIDPFDQVKDGDIRTILYNSSVKFLGTQNSNLWCGLLRRWAVPGIHAGTVCRHDGVRGDRKTTNQASGGTVVEVLPTGIRRAYPNIGAATRQDRKFTL